MAASGVPRHSARLLHLVAWAVAVTLALATTSCTGGERQQGAAPSAPSAAATGTPSWPEPADKALAADEGAALQQVLDEWVGEGEVAGATAAVATVDGSWSGAAGVDGTGGPLRPDSAVSLASITKTFVAAEVLLLSAQGLVDLDAPLTDYVDLPFDGGGATVRQALAMRSGFPEVAEQDVVELATADPDRQVTASDVLATVEPDDPRQGALGLGQAYNNLNYVLLGLLIEEVGGDPWQQAVRRDLLDPAGLDRIWAQDAERPEPPIAWPVPTADDGGAALDGDSGCLPTRAMATTAGAAGGMAGDAPSVARWAALLYGGHVLPPHLVAQMTSGADEDWYGLGTVLGELDGSRTVGHDGSIVGYHGLVVVWPDSATSVAVLVPQTSPDVYDTPAAVVAGRLRDAVAR